MPLLMLLFCRFFFLFLCSAAVRVFGTVLISFPSSAVAVLTDLNSDLEPFKFRLTSADKIKAVLPNKQVPLLLEYLLQYIWEYCKFGWSWFHEMLIILFETWDLPSPHPVDLSLIFISYTWCTCLVYAIHLNVSTAKAFYFRDLELSTVAFWILLDNRLHIIQVLLSQWSFFKSNDR